METEIIIPESIQKHPIFQAYSASELTNDALLDCLSDIVDSEIIKPADQADGALIEQCSVLMVKLIPPEVLPTEYEMQCSLERIHAEMQKLSPSMRRYRTRIWKRVMVAAALLIFVMSLSLAVVARSQAYDNAFEFVADKVSCLLGLKTGEEMESGSITVIRNGEHTKYSSIEELLKGEALHILYPTKLPEKLQIKSVDIVTEAADRESIYFNFQNKAYSLSIQTDYTDLSKLTNYTVYQSNGRTFYILQINGYSIAKCQFNGYEYAIGAPNNESLQEIINSLKEIP